MATAWRFVAYYALPVPIVLLVLLNIPAPRVFRKGVLTFVQRVFGLSMIGAFQLLHVMLFLTGMALLSSVRVLHNLRSMEVNVVWPTANSELTHLSRRWRAERNSWIAAYAFTMWCVLAAFYREAVRRLSLEEKLDALKRTAAEPIPAARPREQPAAPRAAPIEEKPAEAAPRTTPAERVVAQPPAPVEPTAGIQMQELKKEL